MIALAAVVHGDQAGVGERVVALERVREGDLRVAEQDRASGRLGNAHGVTASSSDSLSRAPIMQAMVSTRVGSSCASCLTVTQCTSPTGAKIARTTASTCACFAASSDSIAAMASCRAAMPPKVSAYSSGVWRSTKIEGWHGCVDGLDDVVATRQQTRVRCGRVEREHDGARLHLRNDVGRDGLQREVGDGEDDDVGVGDGGRRCR